MHETELIVRYAETDQMGIVHHSNYPIWFEAARTEFIRNLGVSYSKIEEMGLMLPLMSIHCEYLKPARYEDRVLILTKVKEYTGVRLIFSYEVLNKADGSLLARGESEHAWTDLKLKPVVLKKVNPKLHNIIIENK